MNWYWKERRNRAEDRRETVCDGFISVEMKFQSCWHALINGVTHSQGGTESCIWSKKWSETEIILELTQQVLQFYVRHMYEYESAQTQLTNLCQIRKASFDGRVKLLSVSLPAGQTPLRLLSLLVFLTRKCLTESEQWARRTAAHCAFTSYQLPSQKASREN